MTGPIQGGSTLSAAHHTAAPTFTPSESNRERPSRSSSWCPSNPWPCGRPLPWAQPRSFPRIGGVQSISSSLGSLCSPRRCSVLASPSTLSPFSPGSPLARRVRLAGPAASAKCERGPVYSSTAKVSGQPDNPNPQLGANMGGLLAPIRGLGLSVVRILLQLTSS